MAQVGVFVQNEEIPAATTTDFDVATGFVVGFADWGPVGQAVPLSTLTNVASKIGTPSGTGNPYSSRTTTCATSFDALETFFAEGGYQAYFSRVVGSGAIAATHTLLDGSGSPSLVATAAYVGAGGNALGLVVATTGSTFIVSVEDSLGNLLAISPTLTTQVGAVAWAATTGLLTFAVGAGGIPITVSTPAALTGGNDQHGGATLTNWQNALAALYPSLGPGQVFAPGQTNTNLSGIWSALGLHAQTNNRVALLDMDDNEPASTLKANAVGFSASGVATYCGFWAGNVTIPGAVAGTTRSVSPSAAIAGLCARVDAFDQGNVNQAAAGVNWPLQFATGNTSVVSGTGGAIYSSSDLYDLNDSGINTFASVQGLFVNYGFVSTISSTSDVIYWQLNHGRLRMAIVSDSQTAGQPFVFSEVDGGGGDTAQYQGALTQVLTAYYNLGALFGETVSDAFTVDTGPTVNTPQTLQAGQLNAAVAVRMSPFAQKVTIIVNAVPITTTLTPVAASA